MVWSQIEQNRLVFDRVKSVKSLLGLKGLKLFFFSLLFQITAATCDFLSIVKELLQSGADCSIADNEGFQPADVTDSSAIKELLNT